MISATELQTSSECAYQPLTKGHGNEQLLTSSANWEKFKHWMCQVLPPAELSVCLKAPTAPLFQPGTCRAETVRLASKFSSLHFQTDFAAPSCSCECTQQEQLVPGTRFVLLGLCSLSPARCCFLFTTAFSWHFLLLCPAVSTIIVSHLYPGRRQRNRCKIKVPDAPKDGLKFWSFPRASTIIAVALELTGHFP